MRYRFFDCYFDCDRHELRRADKLINLSNRAYTLLVHLVENRHRSVSRDELEELLWPGHQEIGPEALNGLIRTLRRALGDAGLGRDKQQMIRTEYAGGGRRGGYRFSEAVEELEPGVANDESSVPEVDSTPPAPPAPQLELKQATALACLLRDITSQGPEQLHTQRQALYRLAEQQLSAHGGILERRLDVGFLAVFGAPKAIDDQALQALQTAVALAAEHPGLLCIGLHSGPVLADDLITPVDDTFSLALRFAEQAEAGEILLSDATRTLLPMDLPLESNRVHDNDGKPIHSAGHLDSQHSALQQRPLTTRTPFVGRQREFAILQAALDQVRQGVGQTVEVVGEAGLGKSRLLRELRQSLDGHRVHCLNGDCLPHTTTTPYQPILGLLRQAADLREGDPPNRASEKLTRLLRAQQLPVDEHLAPLQNLLGIGGEELASATPAAIRQRTLAALLALCLAGSREQPLVLTVEDLHWGDSTSEAFLQFLVPRLSAVPVLLLLSYRPGYRSPWADEVTRLVLSPLSREEARAVVQGAAPEETLSSARLQAIIRAGAGNPLFLEELARALSARSRAEIPHSLQAVIAARIDQLPASAKRLLQMAAVIGMETPENLLRAVAELDETGFREAVAPLEQGMFVYRWLLAQVATLGFRHPLIQEAAYQSLTDTTRESLHRRIVQVLEAELAPVAALQPELLAHHCTRAGLPEQASQHWLRAGERAVARTAYAEAISHFQASLAALDELPASLERSGQALRLNLLLGACLTVTLGWTHPAVEETYQRARLLSDELEDQREIAPLLVELALGYYSSRADYEDALQLARRLQEMGERENDATLLLQAFHAQGLIAFCQGRFRDARDFLGGALDRYDPEQHHGSVILHQLDPGVSSHAFASCAHWFLGEAGPARTHSRQCLKRARELGHPFSLMFAHCWAGVFHQFCREPEAALRQAEQGLALANREEVIYYQALGSFLKGWALAEQGQFDTGIPLMEQGLAGWESVGAGQARTWYLGLIAEACARAGRVAAGLAALERAFELMEATDERVQAAELYRVRGELQALDGGSPQAVLDDLDMALQTAREQGAVWFELRALASRAHWSRRHGAGEVHGEELRDLYSRLQSRLRTDNRDLRDVRELLG